MTIILFLAGLSVAASADPAFAILQKQGPVSLEVARTTAKDQLEVPLSGSLRFRIAVDGGKDLEVERVASPLGDSWQVRVAKPAATSSLEGSRQRWQQEFLLEPLKPGQLTLSLAPLRFREKPGAWQTIEWKPMQVSVQTSLSKADVQDLRDITAIEEVPGRDRGSAWSRWLWVGCGLVAMVVMVAGLRVWQGRRKTSTLSPEQRANRALDRILALGLVSAGKTARFHSLAGNVIRRYLQRRYQLPARFRTTAELLQLIESAPNIPPDQQTLLRQFFQRCDLAKFSGNQVPTQECPVTVEMARKLINQAPIRQSF